MFDVLDFQYFNEPIQPDYLYRVWDMAFSVSHTADYTVGALVGVTEEDDGNHYWVGDIIRGRWKGGKVIDLIGATAK